LLQSLQEHLPAGERRDVDALCGAVASSDEDKIRLLVESSLARVWNADDWAAVIRSPTTGGAPQDVLQE
jgi:hypothetical protein